MLGGWHGLLEHGDDFGRPYFLIVGGVREGSGVSLSRGPFGNITTTWDGLNSHNYQVSLHHLGSSVAHWDSFTPRYARESREWLRGMRLRRAPQHGITEFSEHDFPVK